MLSLFNGAQLFLYDLRHSACYDESAQEKELRQTQKIGVSEKNEKRKNNVKKVDND